MQKCKGKPYSTISFLNDDSKNLRNIISQNSEEFIDYIHKLGLSLEYKSKTTNYEYQSTTILTLKTRCFKVDLNDNLVKISPLK